MEPKPKKKSKIAKKMCLEVSVSLSPEMEDHLTLLNANIDSIAQELSRIANTQTRVWEKMSRPIEDEVTEDVEDCPACGDRGGPHVTGRCPVCGRRDTRTYDEGPAEDVANVGEVILTEAPPVFPDDMDFDPEDDIYATGKECPNCGAEGEGAITKHVDGVAGMEAHYHCEACHHIWPYVMRENREPSVEVE